jgi:hypothetical protein
MSAHSAAARELALRLPLSQFFSVPFIRKALACNPGPATRISTTIFTMYAQANPEMTVSQLVELLDKVERKKLFKAIGGKNTNARGAFVRLCNEFDLQALLPDVVEMNEQDFELSEAAKKAIEVLKYGK